MSAPRTCPHDHATCDACGEGLTGLPETRLAASRPAPATGEDASVEAVLAGLDRANASLAASRPAPDTRTEALNVEALKQAHRNLFAESGQGLFGGYVEALAAEYERLSALSPSKGSDPA